MTQTGEFATLIDRDAVRAQMIEDMGRLALEHFAMTGGQASEEVLGKLANLMLAMRVDATILALWEDGLVFFSWDEEIDDLRIHSNDPMLEGQEPAFPVFESDDGEVEFTSDPDGDV
jgi:hypothetical protein